MFNSQKINFDCKTIQWLTLQLSKMKLFAPLSVLLGLCIAAQCERISYENYQILSIQVNNEKHLNVVKAIESLHEDVIFLTQPSTQISTDIVVPPRKINHISEILGSNGIEFAVKSENLQQ